MKIVKLTKLVLLSSAFLWGSSGSVAQEASVAEGAKVYSENCARCHNPRPADQLSAQEWSVVIPHMRVKAHLTGAEARDVEAFLKASLPKPKPVMSMMSKDKMKGMHAKKDKQGEQLVSQYGCQGCHQVNGEGGTMGPNLDTVYEQRGADFIKQKLANPTFNNPASAMPKFPLSKGDIDNITDYLKQLGS